MAFSDLKKTRGKNNINKLVQEAEKLSTPASKPGVDERMWKPSVDKSGNGYAVIRFLPAPEGEELPWTRYWDHGFKGPTGMWYIEKSLTTLGEADPVSEMNSRLWNSGREEDKEVVRERKRRLHYVSNIYVVQDPANPQNEGKVFLYQYGKKIFDKIMDIMQPEFDDEDPVDPFDFWEGADFKLKMRNVAGYRNYDKSEFAKPSPLLGGDDDELEKVYNSMYSLKDYVAPENFKSYEELKTRLYRVLSEGTDDNPVLSTAESVSVSESTSASSPKESYARGQKTSEAASTGVSDDDDDDDDDDDTMSYFAKLAAQE